VKFASWIAAGTPPIYFGFRQHAGRFPRRHNWHDQQGVREVGRAGRWFLPVGRHTATVPHYEHVKVVSAANHAAILPVCRAVVHHGGAGTTAAGLRAGSTYVDPLDAR